jgi:hypothetical protein
LDDLPQPPLWLFDRVSRRRVRAGARDRSGRWPKLRIVGTISNAKKFRVAAYRDHLAKEFYAGFVTTYRSLGQRSFALLGESKDKSFYERVVFSCDDKLISSFAILYPSDQGNFFYPLLEVIEKSFGPGFTTTCSGPPHKERRRSR